mgnify:CR=1 FL=1
MDALHTFSQTCVHATSIRGGYTYLCSSLSPATGFVMFETIKDGFPSQVECNSWVGVRGGVCFD